MKQTEAVLPKAWSGIGLVKTRRVVTDTTIQPRNISYADGYGYSSSYQREDRQIDQEGSGGGNLPEDL